jgi:hypothetical protein
MIQVENLPLPVDTDDAGVEVEETSGEEIREPFDPTQIRVATQPMTIDLLLKRINNKPAALVLNPDFQRSAGIWNDKAQSRLIESILIRIPIPAFYFDATDEDRWLVVDGLQRLTAINRFVIKQDLHLQDLEFLKFNDATYNDLPPRYQRRILETQVVAYFIEPGTPANVKFNIFRRINTGGLPLSPQEIRHALNQGPATRLLAELAQLPEFQKAIDWGVSDKRMSARELVLRFLAFRLTPYTQYMGDFDAFLNEAMEKLNKMEDQFPGFMQDFQQSMQRANDIFGRDAFRKRYLFDAARLPVNKALFETWAVNLAQLSIQQFDKLKENRENLVNRFLGLVNSREFNEAISQGTGDKSKVRTRFSKIAKIIEEALG